MKDPVQDCHIVGLSFASQTSIHDHIIFHFDKYGLSKNKVTRGHKVYCRVMELPVVVFSREGYKIRKIFG